MRSLFFAAALPILMLRSCGDPPKRAELVVFVDTTASLNNEQTTSVAQLAKRLLQTEREYEKVSAYPINGAETPVAIFSEDVTDAASRQKEQREDWARKIDGAFKHTKGNTQTCILNSAEFASTLLPKGTALSRSVDLVFITDMLEDCPSTPFGGAVRFNKADIGREISQAAQFQEKKVDLSSAKVYMITPEGITPGPHVPRLELREKFWRTFFTRCGSTPELVRGTPPDTLLSPTL